MKLVIVESPAKSKTISHYLGEDYKVEASVGHVRDLAISGKGGLGIDVENNFKPTYVISKDKYKVVANLKKLAKQSDEVILATDPDREGEAIAYSLVEVLSLDKENTKRLEFHEITKTSILNAISSPRKIDMNLVHSQETRRIIDRIIGFKLSSLLQNKIKSQSAGRVQSVALKIICDHEKEILNFKSEPFYAINPKIIKNDKEYELSLYSLKDKKMETIFDQSFKETFNKYKELGSTAKVSNIEEKEKKLSSREPFRTSTLQQTANSSLGFSTKKTTFLSQELYEGVETDEGLVGLITYIRTDSTKISDTFVASAKEFIISNYGKEYYKGQNKIKEVKNAQDAHECIRPTSLDRTPEKMKQYLSNDAYKLYKLIYERTLSSLMSDKKYLSQIVYFKYNDLVFKLVGNKTIFPGFDILKIEEKDKIIPSFELNEEVELLNLELKEDFTKPPLRYSEGKMVKLMEEKGIGRPSTYSSTIQTLLQREYIVSSKGVLSPTEQGILTSNVLTKYFPDLINEEYTAEMEDSLDKIQNGDENELKVINDFYYPFMEHFNEVKEKMYKEPLKEVGRTCPICGSPLVERTGRYGKFVSCSNYPSCKFIEKHKSEEVGRNCPNCGSPLVKRLNKKGEVFIGCSAYPKCHYIEGSETKESEIKYCPKCGATLVKRKSKKGYFYGCSSYPKCDYIEAIKK